MERLTVKGNDGKYSVENMEKALLRLASFEDYYEGLVKGQEEISEKLEGLRNKGKKNSVEFRELFAEKLYGSNALLMLKMRGIE